MIGFLRRLACACLVVAAPAIAGAATTVRLEDLTTTEVRDAIRKAAARR